MAVRFKVRQVAQARGYTQYRLQKETQIDIRVLRRIFRNEPDTSVTTDTLDRIAMLLQVDISELIESVPGPDTPSAML